MTSADFWRNMLAIALFGLLVWVAIFAINANIETGDLCADNGMVMARQYPHGDYGCAKIIPFDDLR